MVNLLQDLADYTQQCDRSIVRGGVLAAAFVHRYDNSFLLGLWHCALLEAPVEQ